MGHIGSVRGRPLVAGLATLALAGLGLAMPTAAAPAPSATDVTLTSGTALQSEWTVTNNDGTDNGLATGGTCPSTSVPGLGVDDAAYDVTGADMTDAFDQGLLFFVNNHQVIAPTNWDVQVDPVTPSLNRVLTSGPTSVGGVNATVEYRALPNQQVLRSTVYLANPGATAVTLPLTMATNFGSDGGTGIVGTSSGDTTFTSADRWLVTSDSPTTPSDPVNTSVIAGPGTLAVTPTVSSTVFDCSGTEGVLATYNVTIPAGATRGLMFLSELSDTNAGALTAAARFNTAPGTNDELLLGLSDAQRASIVNWKLTSASQPDGVIRKAHTHWIGNNIYNTTGHRQTVRSTARRGNVRTFWVRIYNDGPAAATFAAHGVKSPHGVRVKYFSGGSNVTTAMTSVAGLPITRAVGQYKMIKVQMKIGPHATIGARKFAKVIATWTGSGFVSTDTVKAVVRVTR